MKKLIIGSIITIALSSIMSFANPPGAGRGMHGNPGLNNNLNAVPPGLQGKDLPHGLKKKNKTPYGWSQGKKQGWKKSHHRKLNAKKIKLNH